MHSDNDFYDSYRLKVGEINEIWYVRAKISPFLPSPMNLQNLMRNEIRELKTIINNQSQLINNLNSTIEKLLDK